MTIEQKTDSEILIPVEDPDKAGLDIKQVDLPPTLHTKSPVGVDITFSKYARRAILAAGLGLLSLPFLGSKISVNTLTSQAQTGNVAESFTDRAETHVLFSDKIESAPSNKEYFQMTLDLLNFREDDLSIKEALKKLGYEANYLYPFEKVGNLTAGDWGNRVLRIPLPEDREQNFFGDIKVDEYEKGEKFNIYALLPLRDPKREVTEYFVLTDPYQRLRLPENQVFDTPNLWLDPSSRGYSIIQPGFLHIARKQKDGNLDFYTQPEEPFYQMIASLPDSNNSQLINKQAFSIF